MACLGRCHAPMKSRRTSSTGDERHSERWSGPTADSLKESQLAAGRGAFTFPSDVADEPNRNSKPEGSGSRSAAPVTSRARGGRSAPGCSYSRIEQAVLSAPGLDSEYIFA